MDSSAISTEIPAWECNEQVKITGQAEVGVCLSDVRGQFLEDPEGEDKELPLDRAM